MKCYRIFVDSDIALPVRGDSRRAFPEAWRFFLFVDPPVVPVAGNDSVFTKSVIRPIRAAATRRIHIHEPQLVTTPLQLHSVRVPRPEAAGAVRSDELRPHHAFKHLEILTIERTISQHPHMGIFDIGDDEFSYQYLLFYRLEQ